MSNRLIPVKDYDELEAWIYRISGKHDFNTEVFKIGETEEGRNIVGLHIGDKNHSSDKPKARTKFYNQITNLGNSDFYRVWYSCKRMDCPSSLSTICARDSSQCWISCREI